LEYVLEVKVLCSNTSCGLLCNRQKVFAIKLITWILFTPNQPTETLAPSAILTSIWPSDTPRYHTVPCTAVPYRLTMNTLDKWNTQNRHHQPAHFGVTSTYCTVCRSM
jgi:hypothetical protein